MSSLMIMVYSKPTSTTTRVSGVADCTLAILVGQHLVVLFNGEIVFVLESALPLTLRCVVPTSVAVFAE